jgi:signal transduction histidine kinase
MVIISSFDILFLIFVEYVLKSPDFVTAVLGGKCLERLITLIISKGSLVLIFFIIRKKKWKVSISITTALLLILFAVVSFYSMQYLIEMFFLSEYEKTQEIIFIAFAFMSLFFMSVILVLNGQEKMKRKVKEKEHIESELRITQERNQELIETYGEIAKVSHDFKNQMRVTLLMLKEGNVTEAQSYLSRIVEIAATSTMAYTGISSIDTVLSEKVRVASENDIEIELDISISSLCGLDSIDVCTIMLNLFDNAIEACLKIRDESHRKIKFVLKNINSMLFLKISNSVSGNNISPKHYSVMNTTKKDKTLHGFGMKIINSLVEKYSGSLNINSENNSFTVTILLCN